jgi:hypothetical protein
VLAVPLSGLLPEGDCMRVWSRSWVCLGLEGKTGKDVKSLDVGAFPLANRDGYRSPTGFFFAMITS